MLSHKEDIVLDFIRQFRSLDSKSYFSNDMSFWFAIILQQRFYQTAPKIMYDPIINHFACEIDKKIYDINGDITNNTKYSWNYWNTYRNANPICAEYINKNYIDRIPDGVITCTYCPHHFINLHGVLICDIDNIQYDRDNPCNKNLIKGEF